MCIPDIFILVDVDLVKLVRAEFIFQRAHVSDHLQGHKARQDRQHQPLLMERSGEFMRCPGELCMSSNCVSLQTAAVAVPVFGSPAPV